MSWVKIFMGSMGKIHNPHLSILEIYLTWIVPKAERKLYFISRGWQIWIWGVLGIFLYGRGRTCHCLPGMSESFTAVSPRVSGIVKALPCVGTRSKTHLAEPWLACHALGLGSGSYLELFSSLNALYSRHLRWQATVAFSRPFDAVQLFSLTPATVQR